MNIEITRGEYWFRPMKVNVSFLLKDMLEAENLIKVLTEGRAEMIDFDRLGSCQWSERKGSKNRTFYNYIKEKPSEEQLLKEFGKLNLDCY